MSQKNAVWPMPLMFVDTDDIATDTWTVAVDDDDNEIVGYPLIMLRITNASSQDIYISFDGVNKHEFIEANSRIEINFQANQSPNNQVSKLPSNTKLYVQGPTSQDEYVYFSGYFNQQ